MGILLIVFCIACGFLGLFYIRLRMDIRSLSKQLEEINRGSHMELVIASRQKPLLALCQRLNHTLTQKDTSYIQYEKTEKLLKQNITSLAHDIRTPLTGATGYVQLARECEESGKRAHYLDAAGKRLSELENMLEEMFLYTKLSTEEFTLSIKPIQVLPLLGECLLSLYTKFEDLGVSPDVVFESEGFCVQADEEALKRIFLNLIQNALLHGAGGISIFQKDCCLVFENPVEKNCIPDPEQIFDRFYKGDHARRKGSSGLGLFIVRELAKKMGGKVHALLDIAPEKCLLKILLYLPKTTQTMLENVPDTKQGISE